VNGVKGVGLALEVGVRAGRLGNVAGLVAATVAVVSALEADFEHPESARTNRNRTKTRFSINFSLSPRMRAGYIHFTSGKFQVPFCTHFKNSLQMCTFFLMYPTPFCAILILVTASVQKRRCTSKRWLNLTTEA
jgi:hypothetical protein